MSITETKTPAEKNKITRRQMLKSITVTAAVAATSALGSELDIQRWQEDTHAERRMEALIERVVSLGAVSRQLNDRYDRETEAANLPEARVVYAVEHFSKEPSYTSSPRFLREWAERCSLGVPRGQLTPGRQTWLDNKMRELEEIEGRRAAIRLERGLDVLLEEVDAADDAEYNAWKALVMAKPMDADEAAVRARYMLSLSEEPSDGEHRLCYWIEEFLSSFLPEAEDAEVALAPAYPDPLLTAIEDFQSGLTAYNESPVTSTVHVTTKDLEQVVEVTFGPHLSALEAWEHPAATREGALAALRLAKKECEAFASSEVVPAMVGAALAYFEATG